MLGNTCLGCIGINLSETEIKACKNVVARKPISDTKNSGVCVFKFISLHAFRFFYFGKRPFIPY